MPGNNQAQVNDHERRIRALENWRHDTVDPKQTTQDERLTAAETAHDDLETRVEALEEEPEPPEPEEPPPDPEPPPSHEDDTEVFSAVSTDPFYQPAIINGVVLTGAANAGRAVVSKRMAPYPSALISGPANYQINNAEVQIEIPDLVMRYQNLPGQTGPSFWTYGADASLLASLPLTAEHILEAECEFTGALGGVFKGARFAHTGGLVQFSTQRGTLPYVGPPTETSMPWQAYPSGYTDEVDAYPDGHDQGTQPIGPYLEELFNTGKHLFRWGVRGHSAPAVYDGEMYIDIDEVRVLHVSADTVGVIPTNGYKQWCGVRIMEQIPVGLRATEGWRFGGTQYVTNQPEWKFKVNIDSVKWWAKY